MRRPCHTDCIGVVSLQCVFLYEKLIHFQIGFYGEGAPTTIFLDSVCAPDALEALLKGFSPKIVFFCFIILKVINMN